jgi:hypothetical protein
MFNILYARETSTSVDAAGFPFCEVLFEFSQLMLEDRVIVVVDSWIRMLSLQGLKDLEGLGVALWDLERQVILLLLLTRGGFLCSFNAC